MLSIDSIRAAHKVLSTVVLRTPLQFDAALSRRYSAQIFLKREDLQVVRSYKIRGAYNKMVNVPPDVLAKGVVCASAGNHAQGVAFSCKSLGVQGKIFMPNTTPRQKVTRVQAFGADSVDIILTGDTFDDAYEKAVSYARKNRLVLVHPFDDIDVIAGQGTVGLEISEDLPQTADLVLVPVGGGGLAAGVGIVYDALHPGTKIIGVEPAGAPAMKRSFDEGVVIELADFDTFIDGAAVRRVGNITFDICKRLLSDVITVDEGAVCATLLRLYSEEAIVLEPAGALSVAALDVVAESIVGKTVVCVVSGSNNDISRTPEIQERALLYEGLKHYFLIRFPQRAGALREFVNDVLGPGDDIVHFEYTKKHNREKGSALVGIELKSQADLSPLLERLDAFRISYEYINDKPALYRYLL